MNTIFALLLLVSEPPQYTPLPQPNIKREVIPYVEPKCIHKIPLGTYCPYCDHMSMPYVPLIPNFYFYPNRIGFYWGL